MITGTSLVAQWLRLSASIAGGRGSIPRWGTKIPCAVQHGLKEKKKTTNVITVPNQELHGKEKEHYPE